jgi:hypothetical protein
MSAPYYEGHAILQVTTGQCARCRTRPVFSVLVEESSEDGEHYRTFYTCEGSLIPWRYCAHECSREVGRNARWKGWKPWSLLQWLRPRSAPVRATKPIPYRRPA